MSSAALMRFRPVVLLLCLAGAASPALAHPAPYSYLDLRLGADGVDATLVVHVIDLAHELALDDPARLLDPRVAAAEAPRMYALLTPRLAVDATGAPVRPEFRGLEVLADRDAIRFALRFVTGSVTGAMRVRSVLFPYDPNHQTFVNVYEDGALRHQAILDRTRASLDYFRGTPQGHLAVIGRFVAEGVRHIVIGPDHVLFLVGLLLLGGSMSTLVRIVTAFTVAHSVTLSLAALDVVSPSARLVEPAIALSIVYVGADNLLVTGEGRDVRAWIAFAFGLIHGFGFAGVLKEVGLPPSALGWSLFSFNVGVEIGQLAVVLAVASVLEGLRRQSAAAGRRLVVAGSVAVIAAGAYWFVERVFLGGV